MEIEVLLWIPTKMKRLNLMCRKAVLSAAKELFTGWRMKPLGVAIFVTRRRLWGSSRSDLGNEWLQMIPWQTITQEIYINKG
jgi:hypothetical protein